jgi:uncharacterized membrane protein
MDTSGDRTVWSKTRVEALSDAVFAIAMAERLMYTRKRS